MINSIGCAACGRLVIDGNLSNLRITFCRLVRFEVSQAGQPPSSRYSRPPVITVHVERQKADLRPSVNVCGYTAKCNGQFVYLAERFHMFPLLGAASKFMARPRARYISNNRQEG